jgi:DNA-binding transcriptional LysR family regulator
VSLVHSCTVLPRSFPATFEQAVLLEEPVLLVLHPDQETSSYEMIQRACGAAGFVPDIRARSSDFAVLTALVGAGASVALMPRMALGETSAPLGLHPLLHETAAAGLM